MYIDLLKIFILYHNNCKEKFSIYHQNQAAVSEVVKTDDRKLKKRKKKNTSNEIVNLFKM